MNGSTKFTYTYSAAARKEARQIREKYLPREESKLEELKRLDHRVQTSGLSQALTLGTVGFLLFGLGICMTLGTVGGGLPLGLPLSLAGIILMPLALPVYRVLLGRAKKRLVPRILALAAELSDPQNTPPVPTDTKKEDDEKEL